LKKDLPKAVKDMKAGDRVILIGADPEPFDADLKLLSSLLF
jgi:hypothetical protein